MEGAEGKPDRSDEVGARSQPDPGRGEVLGRKGSEPRRQQPAPDPVDESNKDSFPASDPPSWWAGHEVRRGPRPT